MTTHRIHRGRPPRDRYGLVLSTTAEAAAAYDIAVGRILKVQAGAEVALFAALRADPGFALGHASLALLGHEFGVDLDVEAALRRAEKSLRRCSDRERRFVHVVAHRIRRPGAPANRALVQHIRAFPRDAVALSIAVPTIAFAGAYDVPADAWSLVEGLAPSYGDDWWYAALLAFIRQEQERWSEAAALAEHALAIEPAAGHAVHARAHVHFETGDHATGLRWLDRWIETVGPGAHHGAHFSWHAALHELALGDDAAVRRRYAAQLAPPRVTGARALVDSASLLWRCALESAWDGPLPVGEVLTAAGPELVANPPSAFVAMHSAVALAAAEDATALARLQDRAHGDARAIFRMAIAPLAGALAAYVEERFDDAANQLLPLGPALAHVGGSAAQREVVQDTLLHALLNAGRLDEAQAVLERRLDRRPSRRDMRQLALVHARSADAYPEQRSELVLAPA